MAELSERKWTMKYDGSTTTALNDVGVMLSYKDGDTMPLSFKLKFPCSNNAAEYDAT